MNAAAAGDESKEADRKVRVRKWRARLLSHRTGLKTRRKGFQRSELRPGTADGGAHSRRNRRSGKSRRNLRRLVLSALAIVCLAAFFAANFDVSVSDDILQPLRSKVSTLADRGLSVLAKFGGAAKRREQAAAAKPQCRNTWSQRALDERINAVTRNRPPLAERGPMEWIKYPGEGERETPALVARIVENESCACHGVRTARFDVLGLSEPREKLRAARLLAGPVHELLIVAVGTDGRPRCAGGDFFEADLSTLRWKSRPPVLDNQDGTYRLLLQVDPQFADYFTLKIGHLFHNFHAFDRVLDEEYCTTDWPEICGKSWVKDIEFVLPNPLVKLPLPLDDQPSTSSSLLKMQELKACTREDFELKQWSGRWTRDEFNETCNVNSEGRYQCLALGTACNLQWCNGPVGRLESNGWVYSSHCQFKIFDQEEAWKCLDGKWIFWWGDSQHQDTVSNLLNYVLGCRVSLKVIGRGGIGRRDDRTYYRGGASMNSKRKFGTRCRVTRLHSKASGQSVRITNVFNGHEKIWVKNNHGLSSLKDASYQRLIRGVFDGDVTPDVLIMNSGLHDGCHWHSVSSYVDEGLELGATFWNSVLESIRPRPQPRVIYHTSVAAAGNSRMRGFNPHKMEVYNKLMVERLQMLNLTDFWIVDGYDLTFPWHFDHENSDGLHYGIHPSKQQARAGQHVHQYFVDLMLVHILLNSLCQK